MRSKKFSILVFFSEWETYLDRVLAFDPTEESCYLGRIATAKCSQIPYQRPMFAVAFANVFVNKNLFVH